MTDHPTVFHQGDRVRVTEDIHSDDVDEILPEGAIGTVIGLDDWENYAVLWDGHGQWSVTADEIVRYD